MTATTASASFQPLHVASDTGRIVSFGRDLPCKRGPLEPGASASHHLPSGPGFGVTWDQAQKAIDDFTLIFTAHFPFIILDHDVTPNRLFAEKPLLFQAILMIAIDLTSSKSREVQRSIDAWIGQHLLVMQEQNIGILQGLIVYIAWANSHFYSDGRATQLMYLAVGLAHSLGITKQQMIPHDTQAKNESEVNEERRAYLACYYILSFNSFQFGRPHPLSSSYVQHCVDALERSSEFPTDFLVIKLVKLRQFIGRVPAVYEGLCEMKWCREISEDASDQLRDIRKDLDDFMNDVTHKHPKFLLLWNLHHSALIQLHLPMTYAAPDSDGTTQLQLECMQYCLQASRTFVTMAKSYSPDGFLYAPFTTLADMTSIFIAISRLLLVNINGWDLVEARKSIDIQAAIDDVLGKMIKASQIKAERVAAAAIANPASYIPDGPDTEKQDRLQIFFKLIESIRAWLGAQGVFHSRDEDSEQSSEDEPSAHTPIYVNAQSPLWDFTYFFNFILQVEHS
ncbi:putative fungal transcriptional regulatory protein [Rosellinia necatrix]|uniref:Putative fungal transcriptional regulatory protein n=1 Tax=Rosellinia necatrix TaxID=77044 RepID=A0A1W2TW22_ROSNE|nr:putative fungal transcriptional regulatory protein [Rosellinia necatrix]